MGRDGVIIFQIIFTENFGNACDARGVVRELHRGLEFGMWTFQAEFFPTDRSFCFTHGEIVLVRSCNRLELDWRQQG